MESPLPQPDDLSKSLTCLAQDSTIIAVIEMSQSSWLVAGIVPGTVRHPLKKLNANEGELLRLLERWRVEASKAGRTIKRIAVAFEAGRDGFWLARWLRSRAIEAYIIHPASVAVSREHRRAKTDRLDTGLIPSVFPSEREDDALVLDDLAIYPAEPALPVRLRDDAGAIPAAGAIGLETTLWLLDQDAASKLPAAH